MEGFENDALAGLSRTSPFLSFEVNSEFPDAAIKCVRQRCFTPNSRFNLTLGLGTEFVFSHWASSEEMVQFLGAAEFLSQKTYGDILVRTEA